MDHSVLITGSINYINFNFIAQFCCEIIDIAKQQPYFHFEKLIIYFVRLHNSMILW